MYGMSANHIAIATQHLHNSVRPGKLINVVLPTDGGDIMDAALEIHRAIDQTNFMFKLDGDYVPSTEMLAKLAENENIIFVFAVRGDTPTGKMMKLMHDQFEHAVMKNQSIIFVSKASADRPFGYFTNALAGRMVTFEFKAAEVA